MALWPAGDNFPSPFQEDGFSSWAAPMSARAWACHPICLMLLCFVPRTVCRCWR